MGKSWTVEAATPMTAKKKQRSDRVIHREHTDDPAYVHGIRELSHFTLSDGTRMLVEATEGKHGQEIDSYGALLRELIKFGVNDYQGLTRARKEMEALCPSPS